jgi:hypothetical protein
VQIQLGIAGAASITEGGSASESVLNKQSLLKQLLSQDPQETTFKVRHSARCVHVCAAVSNCTWFFSPPPILSYSMCRCFPSWYNRSGFDVDYSREDLASNDGDCDDDGDMGEASSAAHVHGGSRDRVDHDDQMDHDDLFDDAFREENIKRLLQDIPPADVEAIVNDKRLGPIFTAYW